MLKDFIKDISIFRKIKILQLRKVASRYKRFSIFTSLSTTANTISTQVTPLLFSIFFGPIIVGFYSIAISVVSMPMTLIGNAIGQVFFQKASEEKNKTGNIKNIVTELHQDLFKLGIFPTLLLIILGPLLFSLIFGEAWLTAGHFAAILAPWFFLVFISSPLSTLFSVLEKVEIILILNITVLVSRISVLIIGGMLGDVTFTLILFSFTGIIFVGGSNYYLLKLAGSNLSVEIINDLKNFLIALILILPLIIIIAFNVSHCFVFGLSGLLSFLYYFVIIREDPLLKAHILNIIRK